LDKIAKAKQSLVDEQSKLIQQKVNDLKSDLVKRNVAKANEVALQALQKEMALEKILQREEEERERMQENELLNALKKEKEKKR